MKVSTHNTPFDSVDHWMGRVRDVLSGIGLIACLIAVVGWLL